MSFCCNLLHVTECPGHPKYLLLIFKQTYTHTLMRCTYRGFLLGVWVLFPSTFPIDDTVQFRRPGSLLSIHVNPPGLGNSFFSAFSSICWFHPRDLLKQSFLYQDPESRDVRFFFLCPFLSSKPPISWVLDIMTTLGEDLTDNAIRYSFASSRFLPPSGP